MIGQRDGEKWYAVSNANTHRSSELALASRIEFCNPPFHDVGFDASAQKSDIVEPLLCLNSSTRSDENRACDSSFVIPI